MLESTRNFPAYLIRNSCEHAIEESNIKIELEYYRGVLPKCEFCHKEFNWWDSILKTISMTPFKTVILSPIGAQSTWFEFKLKPWERCNIDLTSFGVPKDATLLEVSFLPNGSLFPLLYNGNPVWPVKNIEKQLKLFPGPFTAMDHPTEETTIYASVVWILLDTNEQPWLNLSYAFENFANNNYEKFIFPANVAIETLLINLLWDYFKRCELSEKRIQNFLNDAATYSHQLNVILPQICFSLNLPKIDNPIIGNINRLRKLRNEIAHNGKLTNTLTRREAAELLAASYLGFHYLNLIRDKIL